MNHNRHHKPPPASRLQHIINMVNNNQQVTLDYLSKIPSFKITTRQEYDMALYLIEKITLEMTKYNCMIASPEAVLAAGR